MPEQMNFSDLAPKTKPRVVVFDLETLRSADEVGGWSQLGKMGMACGVCYDSVDDAYSTYDETQVSELIAHLKRADLVVGYNHIRFDYAVLGAYSNEPLTRLANFDILVDVEKRLGHRLKLDSLVKATLHEAKSADGMQSLRWVKEGRLDLVRAYCKKDVEVTWKLFDYGVREGQVFYDNYGSAVTMPVEWSVPKLIESARGRKGV